MSQSLLAFLSLKHYANVGFDGVESDLAPEVACFELSERIQLLAGLS